MKQLFIAALFMAVSLPVYSQAADEEFEYTFRVKLASATKPVSASNKMFRDFSDVEGITFPDGYIRYFTGKFETYNRAKSYLAEVKAKGYKDAYVICIHDGKILTADQAISEIYGE